MLAQSRSMFADQLPVREDVLAVYEIEEGPAGEPLIAVFPDRSHSLPANPGRPSSSPQPPIATICGKPSLSSAAIWR